MGHSDLMDMLCATFAFIDGLGAPEMGLIFILVLVLFGGQKLPEFARGLGKSIREFKKAAAGVEDEFKRALEEDERKHIPPALPEPSPVPPNPAASDPAGPDTGADYYDHDHSYDHDGSDKSTAAADPAVTTEATPAAESQPATSTPVAEVPPVAPTPAEANAPIDPPAATSPVPAPETPPNRPTPPTGRNPEQT